MKTRAILLLPALFLVCFAVAVFAQSQPSEAGSKGLPANQSISGKISSVGDASFTVALADTKDKQGPQNVEFLLDDKTRVEGKLIVGADALVEYRSDSGRNIAVHVVVTPGSGASLAHEHQRVEHAL